MARIPGKDLEPADLVTWRLEPGSAGKPRLGRSLEARAALGRHRPPREGRGPSARGDPADMLSSALPSPSRQVPQLENGGAASEQRGLRSREPWQGHTGQGPSRPGSPHFSSAPSCVPQGCDLAEEEPGLPSPIASILRELQGEARNAGGRGPEPQEGWSAAQSCTPQSPPGPRS